MRRWFIAVFSLHFFISVGAFAFGKIDIHAPGNGQNQAVFALVGDIHDPTQEDDLLGAAPDHGLTDSQPELPEFIPPVSIPVAVGLPQPAPEDVRRVPPRAPTLEGLQRPPRVHRIHA